MMMFDPKEWLESGRVAVIEGLALRPQPHPLSARMVLSTSRGQATVFYLRDDVGGEWMLKKFHPGRAPDTAHILAVQSLVPRQPGFEAAFLRRCLGRDAVSPTAFAAPEFIDWIEGTLLMPRVVATDWGEVVGKVRDGEADLTLEERVALAESLCAKVGALEGARLAHRDFSATNVMTDPSHGIHLIDWDSLYAPSLRMPANTTAGTNGYTAPFVHDGNDDPSATWADGGDRFALAVLILEAFAAAPGCPLTGDGGLIEQSEINARRGPGIRHALDTAALQTKLVEPLFMAALNSRAASDCPSPADWTRSLRRIAATRRRPALQAASGDFVPLDTSVFVQLHRSAFTPLYR